MRGSVRLPSHMHERDVRFICDEAPQPRCSPLVRSSGRRLQPGQGAPSRLRSLEHPCWSLAAERSSLVVDDLTGQAQPGVKASAVR